MVSMSSSTTHVTDLHPEDIVQSTQPLQLLDVRSRFEYNRFHAPGAINLSSPRILMGQVSILRRWVWPSWFLNLSKDEPIALICLTAHRSPIAAKALSDLGFRQVFNVTGGMMAWQKAGLPIEKS